MSKLCLKYDLEKIDPNTCKQKLLFLLMMMYFPVWRNKWKEI